MANIGSEQPCQHGNYHSCIWCCRDDNLRLESSNALLARKVEILEKCAEHYADEKNWDVKPHSNLDNHPETDWYVEDGDGYTIAQSAIADAARIDEKPSQFRDAIKQLDESISPGVVICRGSDEKEK